MDIIFGHTREIILMNTPEYSNWEVVAFRSEILLADHGNQSFRRRRGRGLDDC